GVCVHALALEADPMMKARPRRIVNAHMPFPDESIVIAGLLEPAWEGHQPVAERRAIGVVGDAMRVRVLTGQETGAAWRPQRRRHESVAKGRAFPGYAVDIRCLDKWMACAAELIPTKVIQQNEDDVGPS